MRGTFTLVRGLVLAWGGAHASVAMSSAKAIALPPQRYALCIGISEYARRESLACHNDAVAMARLACARGFDGVTLLLNAGATRNGIMQASRLAGPLAG